MKEFKINENITLKLEEELIDKRESIKKTKTNIYVNGKKFKYCSFLLVEIPIEEITSLNDLDSIDEAEEKLDSSLEEHKENPFDYKISPEVEFWGHCSNLQVWVENNYNTKLLHRNLAFPLLKRLTEIGDPVAKKVFKEEIVQRFLSCHLPVIHYLLFNNYLDYLSNEELDLLFYEFKLNNTLQYSFLEPVLIIKGYIKRNLETEEFRRFLNNFLSEAENGKYATIKNDKYETASDFYRIIQDWLFENVVKREFEMIKKNSL